MKKFNLEDAKAGKPVVTRDGRDVRIVCFDAKGTNYPLVALIDIKGKEMDRSFMLDGAYCHDTANPRDLMMKSEKKTGWVNIYPDDKNRRIGNCEINPTEEKADLCALTHRIACIKIEWEE